MGSFKVYKINSAVQRDPFWENINCQVTEKCNDI